MIKAVPFREVGKSEKQDGGVAAHRERRCVKYGIGLTKAGPFREVERGEKQDSGVAAHRERRRRCGG